MSFNLDGRYTMVPIQEKIVLGKFIFLNLGGEEGVRFFPAKLPNMVFLNENTKEYYFLKPEWHKKNLGERGCPFLSLQLVPMCIYIMCFSSRSSGFGCSKTMIIQNLVSITLHVLSCLRNCKINIRVLPRLCL